MRTRTRLMALIAAVALAVMGVVALYVHWMPPVRAERAPAEIQTTVSDTGDQPARVTGIERFRTTDIAAR